MLIQRVVTALALLAALIVSITIAWPWGFVLLSLALVAAAVGEWLMLLRLGRSVAIVLAVLDALGFWFLNRLFGAEDKCVSIAFAVVVVIWIGLAVLLLSRHAFPDTRSGRWFYIAAALILPGVSWIALIEAAAQSLVFMLSVLVIVWVADIAAYFSGRAFGTHKLAPSISPGKTIEGAVGGLVGVWLIALVTALAIPLDTTFFAMMGHALPWWLGALALAFLVGLSIVGDLFESHLKRQAGVKDSSRLLPGHGGVYDRLDALLPVLPAAVLLSRLW